MHRRMHSSELFPSMVTSILKQSSCSSLSVYVHAQHAFSRCHRGASCSRAAWTSCDVFSWILRYMSYAILNCQARLGQKGIPWKSQRILTYKCIERCGQWRWVFRYNSRTCVDIATLGANGTLGISPWRMRAAATPSSFFNSPAWKR